MKNVLQGLYTHLCIEHFLLNITLSIIRRRTLLIEKDFSTTYHLHNADLTRKMKCLRKIVDFIRQRLAAFDTQHAR